MGHSSRYVFAYSDDIIPVRCVYEADDEHKAKHGRPAKRTTFKTFDKSIKKDDLVVVETETRHNFTVVKVDEVLHPLDVDVNESEPIRWIVQRVNTAYHESLVRDEQDLVDTVRRGERRANRDKLKQDLEKGMLPSEQARIAFSRKREQPPIVDPPERGPLDDAVDANPDEPL